MISLAHLLRQPLLHFLASFLLLAWHPHDVKRSFTLSPTNEKFDLT
jgi:hypothetical protein